MEHIGQKELCVAIRKGHVRACVCVCEGRRALVWTARAGLTSSLHHFVDLALDVELGVLGFDTF